MPPEGGRPPAVRRGLYEPSSKPSDESDRNGSRFVECEPKTERLGTEQISSLEEGGVEGFLRREVLAYPKDAW